VARLTLEGLGSPHRLGAALPGLYQETDRILEPLGQAGFVQRFTRALDDVLAPVYAALDSLPAYLDPQLTPVDFLDWLAGWVGVTLDETWPLSRRRALVGQAIRIYSLRGTARGLAEQIEIFTGIAPEIEESGGVSWSTTADSPLPGEPVPRVTVRLRAGPDEEIDERRLRALVAAARPAHVLAEVEVVKTR
jgi:phage tail-like protein